ncbi:MAG: DCC1-like thiol-disulfide oxidoreductase family protein [Halolamina sp.]
MSSPRLVYDDDCGFCTWCARIARRYGDVALVGFSELSDADRERLPDDWRESAHLLTDHRVFSGGKAIERTLARFHPAARAAFAVLKLVPGYPPARERLYRWGADRRDWWGHIVAADEP